MVNKNKIFGSSEITSFVCGLEKQCFSKIKNFWIQNKSFEISKNHWGDF